MRDVFKDFRMVIEKAMKKLLLYVFILLILPANADTLKVRIWSGFPPGGGTDRVVREIQRQILEHSNAEVVVEYATGAAGVIALRKLASLEKTANIELLVDGSNQLLTKYVSNTNDVDLSKDIKIVTPIGNTQMVVVASVQSQIYTIKDLSLRKDITYGSAGAGSVTYSTTAYLGYILGLSNNFTNVSYKGTSAFYVDLFSGRIDIASDYLMSAVPYIIEGKLNGLAVTGKTRSLLLPTVPTLREQGILNFPLVPWFGIFSNKNISDSQLLTIRKILAKSFSQAESVKRFKDLGIEVISSSETFNSEQWYNAEQLQYKTFNQLKIVDKN